MESAKTFAMHAGNKENKLRKGYPLLEDNGKVMTICWMHKKPVLALIILNMMPQL